MIGVEDVTTTVKFMMNQQSLSRLVKNVVLRETYRLTMVVVDWIISKSVGLVAKTFTLYSTLKEVYETIINLHP